ncbi:MAG: glycosyltransferase, partial [Alistipes sp.]|nr:glycosyltransferase [Alistipes sp.]
MAQLFDYIISHYGWQGLALGGAIIVLLCVQIYYYLIVYRRISTYRNARRKKKFEQEPPVSVIIPLFSEDYAYLEERLPYIFSQQYGATFEVVIVYVGNDSDFYEELARLRVLHPNLIVTKFDFNPRFPISIKQAINLGIKSSHNEHIIISTPNAKPASDHWLAMMGKAFMRGDIVIGYSGIEQRTGIGNYLMRMSNLQQSIYWLAQAVNGSAYRGIRHNLGFTKTLYFSVRGFSHLSMNIGEDDLFIQRIAKRNNVSVVMIPKGSMIEHPWGGLCWWLGRMRHYGQTWQFYPDWVHSSIQWDLGSQALLFLTAITALIFMPLEFKVATIILLLLRYLIVALRIRSIAKRVGERGAALKYFIFD